MSHLVPLLPETAPFSDSQRSWIDGWIAGRLAADNLSFGAPTPLIEEFPWHDAALPLEERLTLAVGKPKERVLMAAMAQLDCGQCGYLCRTYAEAIASGAEASLSRCVPGGKETARTLKELMSGPLPASPANATPAATASAGVMSRTVSQATFKGALRLNRDGSAKDTRHVVFAVEESFAYEPGDSFGIHARNDPALVDAVIARLGADAGDEFDCPDGTRRPLAEALGIVCDIGRPSDEAVEVLASRAIVIAESQRLQALAEGYPGAEPQDADLLDLLDAFPSARPPVQELISALGVLQPRLYSIASSPKARRGEVHLTVSAVRFTQRGRVRKGIASTYLAERLAPGAEVPAFIQASHGFRLPKDSDRPIIMIGPGTGVAPFRAFLDERRELGARGRNWLFFGDQRRATDFLYEEDFSAHTKDGLLTRLDLAFSRDQPERVYVQQRMRENAPELWAWLQDGAILYICGAAAMAKDVEAGLAAIVARQGGMGLGAAKAYIAELVRDGRFLKDVY